MAMSFVSAAPPMLLPRNEAQPQRLIAVIFT